MKLQLTLNETDLNRAFQQVREVQDSIDIIGLSPEMILRYGYSLIEQFTLEFPGLEILADTQLTDHQFENLEKAFESGARYVTLSSSCSAEFIEDAKAKAGLSGRKIIIDLADPADPAGWLENLESCKADYVTLPVNDPLKKEALRTLDEEFEQLNLDIDAVMIGSSHLSTDSEKRTEYLPECLPASENSSD